MNLGEIIYEIGELGIRSQRIKSDVKNFVNRGQKAIAERRNWSFMHDYRAVTLPTGQTSVGLPATFKALETGKSPISYGDNKLPVRITSRSEIERLGPRNFPTPTIYAPFQVIFLERSGDNWTLNIPQINGTTGSTTDLVFNVSAYWYPEPLERGTDRNAITEHGELSEALVNKAKALAYFAEESDSPKGIAAQALYETALMHAAHNDALQKIAGRNLHW